MICLLPTCKNHSIYFEIVRGNSFSSRVTKNSFSSRTVICTTSSSVNRVRLISVSKSNSDSRNFFFYLILRWSSEIIYIWNKACSEMSLAIKRSMSDSRSNLMPMVADSRCPFLEAKSIKSLCRTSNSIKTSSRRISPFVSYKADAIVF